MFKQILRDAGLSGPKFAALIIGYLCVLGLMLAAGTWIVLSVWRVVMG